MSVPTASSSAGSSPSGCELQGADRAPGYAAGGRWRHAGALPALCRRREDRPEAQGADHRHRPGGRRSAGAAAAPRRLGAAQAEKNAMVWADPTTNALVITAPPKIMRAVMDIIDKLDIRRPQVLVEAIIAEVDVDKDRRARRQLGRLLQRPDAFPAGGFREPGRRHQHRRPRRCRSAIPPTSPPRCCRARPSASAASPAPASISRPCCAPSAATPTPTSSPPSAVTMDNQEAELKVAQEVPFVTGQFTNTTAVTGGSGEPLPDHPARGSGHDPQSDAQHHPRKARR